MKLKFRILSVYSLELNGNTSDLGVFPLVFSAFDDNGEFLNLVFPNISLNIQHIGCTDTVAPNYDSLATYNFGCEPYDIQDILENGWSMISTYIEPFNKSLEIT